MTRIYLPRRTKRTIHCVGLGVWLSGVGWLVAHYLLKDAGALDMGAHPSEPWWLKAHGAFAFMSLWTAGLLWAMHVPKAWATRRRRWSGGTLFASLLLLIVSGYLLYYVADDSYREVAAAVHWILGLAFPLAYLLHRLVKRRSVGVGN